MIVFRIGLLLVIIACCGVAPGFLVTRRLRWRPLEKLCGAVGLSLYLVYVAAFLIYVTNAPRWLNWAVSLSCVALCITLKWELLRHLGSRSLRPVLRGFGFLAVWSMALLLLVRSFGGGGWSGDWIEHLHRTIFFLDRLPVGTTLYGEYSLPARPPMMNVLAAFFLAHAGDGFELLQFVFLVLNLAAFLPCALLVAALRPANRLAASRRNVANLVVLLACSPLFVQNLTYTWTKLLAVFYVLTGIAFYLTGSRKNDRTRIIAGFASMACGMLVHYSAGPYLLFLSLHYGATVLRTPMRKWKEALTVAAVVSCILASWVAWSVRVYGLKGTFASNTAVTSVEKVSASGQSNLHKIAMNVYSTIVPHPLRHNLNLNAWRLQSRLGFVRDYAFLIYQTNVVFAMGIVGGPLVLLLIGRSLRARGDVSRRHDGLFWNLFIPFTLIVGIAVHGERESGGVAHVTLQPLVLLGITFLAANLASLSRVLRWVVIVGVAFDFGIGVCLQHSMENLDNRQGRMVFQVGVQMDTNRNKLPEAALWSDTELSQSALRNWIAKQERVLVSNLLNSAETSNAGGGASGLIGALSGRLESLKDLDTVRWKGWYARHGNRITFLGDHFARFSELIQGLILAMFVLHLVTLRRVVVEGAQSRRRVSGGRKHGGRSRRSRRQGKSR